MTPFTDPPFSLAHIFLYRILVPTQAYLRSSGSEDSQDRLSLSFTVFFGSVWSREAARRDDNFDPHSSWERPASAAVKELSHSTVDTAASRSQLLLQRLRGETAPGPCGSGEGGSLTAYTRSGGRLRGSCSLVATLRSAVSLSTRDLCTVPQQNKERELIAYEWYVAPFAKQA